MKKCIVIGSPGAGKSTFACRLAEKIGLPLYHLDMIWHREDRTHITREAFDMRLTEILRTDRWIIDGNYARTLDMRLSACDTVFFLDYPLEVCLSGAEERVGKPRPDMPWQETVFDEEFRAWIIRWHEDIRPVTLMQLERVRKERQLCIFTNRDEAETYLRELPLYKTR